MVAIGNAGLSCGFSAEDISAAVDQVFSSAMERAPLFRVHLIADKPFALVEFLEEFAAQHCCDLLVGWQFLSSSRQTLPWFPMLLSEGLFITYVLFAAYLRIILINPQ